MVAFNNFSDDIDDEKSWDVYIFRDVLGIYRACIGKDKRIFFAQRIIYDDLRLIAGLEDISEREKDILSGVYDHSHTGTDFLEHIVDTLNCGHQINPQKELNSYLDYVRRYLVCDYENSF